VCYRVATEDDGGLDNGSVDLITVAQALHWFDVDAFAQEADRVLRPGGVLAAWTYNFLNISREIDSCINDFYMNVLGTFWPPERNMVENGYRDISLPFKQIESPRFEMI
jgi:ubiquinone/menaquinone biosynthesis C-methylase UbiE